MIVMRRRADRPRRAARARRRWRRRSTRSGPSGARRRCRSRRRTRWRRGTGGSSSPCPEARRSWETTARGSSSCRSLPCARRCAGRARSRRSATLTVSPGATGAASGTSATVRSSEVPVVWRDEAHGGGDVDWRAARADELEARDVDPAPVRLGTVGRVRAARERALAHPRRSRVAPGVVVQVEAEARRRNRRGVAPGEELLAGERAARRVEPRRDRVAGVARRRRAGRGGDTAVGRVESRGCGCCAAGCW